MKARDIAPVPITWFAAKWPGSCAVCRDNFHAGEDIGYLPGPEDTPDVLIGRACCGDKNLDLIDVDDRHKVNVMPPGKTPKDKCPKCFIIHTAAQGKECW